MNDRLDPTRHTLDDAELEVLLTGKIDDTPELRHNPVAAFLLDARQASFASDPMPDQPLGELFELRQAADPITAPIAVVDEASTAVAADLSTAPAVPAPDEDLALAGPSAGGPIIAAPTEVYKASPFRVLLEALTPSPTKVLMVVSAILLLVIGAQALGAIQLLGGDGGGEDVVAGLDPANTTTSIATTTVPTSAATTTRLIDRAPVDETVAPETTARSTTAAPTTDEPEPTTTVVESTTETTEAPETSESVTTDVSTSSSIDPTTSVETSLPPTSIPSTVTISPSTTAAPTTTSPGVVIIVPGRRNRVPEDLPSGFYSARVSEDSPCSVVITYAEGNSETFQAPAGGTIVFQLFDGSELVTGAGCPQIYRPSAG